MKKPTFNVLFFVKRTRTLKNGALPIYARITISGQRAEFVIQKDVVEDIWDNNHSCAKGTSKQARDINDYLELIKLKLREHKIKMEEHNELLTAHGLRNNYLGINNNNKTILEIFKEHNEKCKGLADIDFSPATVERYITCYKHIEDFIKLKYKRNDLSLNEITPMFIADFEYYMKTVRSCCNNTTIKYIKNFKKIIRIALANGWMKADPFVNIKYHMDDVDLDFLTEDELNILMKKEFKIERLQQVKDIYLFCCFTGLAFIDVKNLMNSNIEEINNQLWIKKKRQKTKNWCHVPIITPAIKILEKYKNHPKCIKSGCALPVLTNQKMNSYLKEIADLCGINKNLSTHTARHTFATTVTLANQVSMEVVSKMLGHSSINMTRKYARVIDDLINKDMQKIYSKYETISL
ncbi:MAG: site-specific integrase [Bacteroidales bacterium]|jgi:site-specific recombinase XerD